MKKSVTKIKEAKLKKLIHQLAAYELAVMFMDDNNAIEIDKSWDSERYGIEEYLEQAGFSSNKIEKMVDNEIYKKFDKVLLRDAVMASRTAFDHLGR